MSNFKKTLENQQRVNEAVQGIFDFFNMSEYFEMYRTMADAQACILQLMEINRMNEANGNCSVSTEEISSFIADVSEVYKLLMPFAIMVGQAYSSCTKPLQE